MKQIHLYGLNYEELPPPIEWEDLSVDATVNDDSTQANISAKDFGFVGATAEFILDWVAFWGRTVGIPYKIIVEDDDDVEMVFKGMIDVRDLLTYSKLDPVILRAPVIDETDNITIIDRASVITQRVLFNQGYYTSSQFYSAPVVQVSKLSAKDRIVALTNLGFTVLNTFFQMIQNLLSAISDMIGVSVVLGVVEFATLMINLYVQIQQLVDLIVQHKDLLLASQTYYNTISLKGMIEAVFAKLDRTVDWGIIESDVSKKYLLSSSQGFPGLPFPNTVQSGLLNARDYGYTGSELIEKVKKKYNIRVHDDGVVVHLKTKSDPYWTITSSFEAPDLLVETTAQYQNGYYKAKTEEVPAVKFYRYQYDPMDPWTLAQDSGDSYELSLEHINPPPIELDLRRGIEDVQYNDVMAVRYDPADVLTDLLNEVLGDFDELIIDSQDIITQFSSYIDPGANAGQDTGAFLALTGINFIFSLDDGGIKVADDTWGLVKFIHADRVLNNQGAETNKLYIPSDHLDKISAEYFYNTYFKPESTGEENNFQGQHVDIKEFSLPLLLADYIQIKTNPYFQLGQTDCKFLHGNWLIKDHKLSADLEINEIFDTNIKYTVVT